MIFPASFAYCKFQYIYMYKSFFDVGAAFAVPKYSKFYLYEYRLYMYIIFIMLALHLQCQNLLNFTYINIACAVLVLHLQCQNIRFTSMNIVCMFAQHLQCKNILNFRYMNIVCMHVGGAFAVPKLEK